MKTNALDHIITWAKLDGYWVLRGPESALIVGKTVQVSKKDGSTSDEVVQRILMVKNGICYAEQKPTPKKTNGSTSTQPSRRRTTCRRTTCRECGGALTNAPHHRAMGGLCGNCAFDEYDC